MMKQTKQRKSVPTLLGVPYDAASSFLRGCADAPGRIREALASDSGNGWSEALIDLRAPGVVGDAGDVAFDGADVRESIQARVAAILDAGNLPLSLGGDHSVTYPILRAVSTVHDQLTVLQIDAHPDLYDNFEGDRYSHACPFARVMEEGLATRLVQVGIRTLNEHQRKQADRFAVDVIDMRAWTRGTRPEIDGPVYVTCDLDVIEPAQAPGVSHWEPGGLTVRDVLTMIQSLRGPIVGADVVEYNPSRDVNGMTAFVAAKIVRELASRMIQTSSGRKG